MQGAEVSISHNRSLALTSVQSLLDRVLTSPNGVDIDGYAAKMPDDLVHVYFFAKHDWADYKEALSLFISLFSRGIYTVYVYIIFFNAVIYKKFYSGNIIFLKHLILLDLF